MRNTNDDNKFDIFSLEFFIPKLINVFNLLIRRPFLPMVILPSSPPWTPSRRGGWVFGAHPCHPVPAPPTPLQLWRRKKSSGMVNSPAVTTMLARARHESRPLLTLTAFLLKVKTCLYIIVTYLYLYMYLYLKMFKQMTLFSIIL